jgi:succinoglycan biosynthesis transport protein ExoP
MNMLQRLNKPLPLSDTGTAVAELPGPGEFFASFSRLIRRQFPVIVSIVFAMLFLGVVYLVTTPPSYTSQATMIIDTRKVQVFQQPSIVGDVAVDSAMVVSQVEVLKSEDVALAVIKELQLTSDPEFVSHGGGLVGTLIDFVSSVFGGNEPKSEFEITRRAVQAFQDRLSVRRVGFTYIIEISFKSSNPDRAAQIANALAEAYIIDQLEAKYKATRRASTWLQDRIRELRQQASTAERAVVDFKTKNNIVDAGGRLMDEQQLAELNSQLVIARAQVSEARARLDRIETVLRADTPDATVNSTVADNLRNDVVTKLRSQYLELANREADWSARYGRNHLAAVHLRNQMREIRNSVLDELRRTKEIFKSDFEIAKQREDGIQKELARAVSQSQATNQAQVALRELESAAQTYRALYDNFLQRYMESVQQQSFPISEARLITQATRPLKKSSPKVPIVLAVTIFSGMMLGLGIGVLREFWDRVFRTSGQVETTLQTNCISVLPIIKSNEAKSAERQRNRIGALAASAYAPGRELGEHKLGLDSKIIARQTNLFWHVVDSPLSRFAEAMRSIKLAADLGGNKSNKVLGITSSLPNEGKSTISVSVAQLISHAGARVILVDCDLRNPSLSRKLAPSAKAGMLEVISGRTPLDQVVWTDPTTNLAFLPSVVNPRLAHTSEILASDQVKTLIRTLATEYDYVIVDLSPLAPVVDVRSTTHFIDSYVFVIEWGRTRVEIVEHALKDARGVYENLLGVVLNKADINLLGRYESYRGSYYYKRYYARYGYSE